MMKATTETHEPSIEVRADRLMKLSEVVNSFMEVKRATFRDGRRETDGEHTLHLQFIAVAYAAQYHPELDIGKVSLYSLVHDFIEVYAGDTNSLTIVPEVIARKVLKEKVAVERLAEELGDMWPYFIQLIHQYEKLEEPEARFVKSFDKCDPHFNHYRDQGEALMRMGVISRDEFQGLCQRVYERMVQYANEFPDVIAIREELIKRVANVTFPTV